MMAIWIHRHIMSLCFEASAVWKRKFQTLPKDLGNPTWGPLKAQGSAKHSKAQAGSASGSWKADKYGCRKACEYSASKLACRVIRTVVRTASDSPSQSISSLFSGRRSTIACFILGIVILCPQAAHAQHAQQGSTPKNKHINSSHKRQEQPSDSPSQSISSLFSGRRSTIACFILGIVILCPRAAHAQHAQHPRTNTSTAARRQEQPSDSPSQSISSLFSGRRSTIAWFILGIVILCPQAAHAHHAQHPRTNTSTAARRQEQPSDSPSQSISSLFSGRRSTIACFILGIVILCPQAAHAQHAQQGSTPKNTHINSSQKARTALRQPVAIYLITIQWKEKYYCMFHPRHCDPLPSGRTCSTCSTGLNTQKHTHQQQPQKARTALRQPVAIYLITIQWKEKYYCVFHPRHCDPLPSGRTCSTCSTPKDKHINSSQKARTALRQPVAIYLITIQWKEKYYCVFHPRHCDPLPSGRTCSTCSTGLNTQKHTHQQQPEGKNSPQTARRNLSHHYSVEGEVLLRVSS